MTLSSREILLVLRARDEATRTISRVSHAMSAMDRNATSTSGRMINEQRAALRGLSNSLGEVNAQYSKTIADSWALHRQQQNATNQALANLRGQVRATNDEYVRLQRAQRDLRDAGRITAADYRQQMKDIDRRRQDQLRTLAQERVAIQDVARANHVAYNQSIADARREHNFRKESIRLQRLSAQEQIDLHRELEHLNRVEKENLRQRGQIIMANSAATVGAGAALTYFGARGTAAYATVIKSSMDYEQSARRTLTQTDGIGASLRKVSEMGKRVANTVPVAFEEIQPAMYDIFSSIDVGLKGAGKLLRQFSKDAVGGTTDLQTATRANLMIMNAYRIGVEDVTKVSDFMFQLVRKGVGSYDEFAKTIGRSIPSARRAGQSYEMLGAMLAFMTRNGLSAAMASTSAARALDAISHPETVKKLEEMGINVKNMRGEFLPLPKILNQLNREFGELTGPERAKRLYELFKSSGGTIQARRFFDQYFKNADEFNQRTREMANHAGAAEKAFTTMAKSPQAQLQQLKNDWMLLRIELGTHLMPIAMKIISTVNDWIDAFKRLSPETQKNIAIAIGLGLALVTLGGILTMLVGGIGLFVGGIKAMGLGVGATSGKLALFGGGLTALASGLYAAKESATKTGTAFGVLASTAGGALAGFSVGGPIGAAVGGLVGLLGGLWMAVKNSSDGFNQAAAPVQRYIDTLDQLTGATTRATREMALQKLEQDNILAVGRHLGLSTRTLIDASLGHKGAIKQVNEAYRGSKDVMDRMMASKMKEWIQNNILALQGEKRQWEINNLALAQRQDLIEKLPKKIQTEVKQVGAEPTKKQIRDVMKEAENLTRKEKRIVVELLGGRQVVREAQEIGKALKKSTEVKPNWDPFLSDLATGGKASVREAENMSKKMKKIFFTSTEQKPNFDPFLGGLIGGINEAEGTASSGGASIGSALKSGLSAGFDGAAAMLAAQARAAVMAAIVAGRAAAKVGSPSKETEKIGYAMAWGLSTGWTKGIAEFNPMKQVSNTVRKLVRELLEGMEDVNPKMSTLMEQARDKLEEKFDAMREAMVNKQERLKDAMQANQEKNRDALDKMVEKAKDKVADAAKSKFDKNADAAMDHLNKAQEAALNKFDKTRDKRINAILKKVREKVEKAWTRLQRVVDKYQAKVKELADARAELERLQSEKASYISGLSSSLSSLRGMSDIQGAEIMENVLDRGRIIQQGTGQYRDVTIDDIVHNMSAKLAKIQEFGHTIDKLRGMGYTAAVIDTILQMGPEQGLQYARALAAATPQQVAHINAADAGITALAGSLASQAGAHMYDVGIAMQQGVVNGLAAKAEELRLKAQALGIKVEEGMMEVIGWGEGNKGFQSGKRFAQGVRDGLDEKRQHVANGARWLARAIVENFNEVLRIKSPSKVGLGIGMNFGGSVRMGLIREKNNLARASQVMARVMEFDPNATHVRTQPYSRVAGGGNTFNQEITVNTQELDPRRNAAALGWELANRGL